VIPVSGDLEPGSVTVLEQPFIPSLIRGSVDMKPIQGMRYVAIPTPHPVTNL